MRYREHWAQPGDTEKLSARSLNLMETTRTNVFLPATTNTRELGGSSILKDMMKNRNVDDTVAAND